MATVVLRWVGIPHLAYRPISRLSGGEHQRTFLVRPLARQFDLPLLDEPFAEVDTTSQKAITRMLHRLRDRGHAVVVIHHGLAIIPTLCDWTHLLNRTVTGFGPTKEVLTDETTKQVYELTTT